MRPPDLDRAVGAHEVLKLLVAFLLPVELALQARSASHGCIGWLTAGWWALLVPYEAWWSDHRKDSCCSDVSLRG